jgi:phage tail-like protein
VDYRSGTFVSRFLRSPGLSKFDPIVLKRGITHDTTFEDWAELVYHPAGDAAMSLRNFRKDMRINLLNQQGSVVLSYMVYRCWVSEYAPLPDLDADANEVAMETIVLEHEGFERDRGVSEPQET